MLKRILKDVLIYTCVIVVGAVVMHFTVKPVKAGTAQPHWRVKSYDEVRNRAITTYESTDGFAIVCVETQAYAQSGVNISCVVPQYKQ